MKKQENNSKKKQSQLQSTKLPNNSGRPSNGSQRQSSSSSVVSAQSYKMATPKAQNKEVKTPQAVKVVEGSSNTPSDSKYKLKPSQMVLDFRSNSLEVPAVTVPLSVEHGISPQKVPFVKEALHWKYLLESNVPAGKVQDIRHSSIGTQTDELFCSSPQEAGEFTPEFDAYLEWEYNTPQSPSPSFDQRCDDQVSSMTWLAGLDADPSYVHYRPTAPDADMMTIGKRLGFGDDSPLEQQTDQDDQEEVRSALGSPVMFRMFPSKHADLIKPNAKRAKSPTQVLVNGVMYNQEIIPISPSVSERTVPSEIGSESSRTVSTRATSAFSSPDVSRVFLAHDDVKSAFITVSGGRKIAKENSKSLSRLANLNLHKLMEI